MNTGGAQWPFVCANCCRRYAAFIVYGRFGRERREFPTCAECGPGLPAWVEGRFDETWHTILRPVPPSCDPVANPYRPTQQTEAGNPL